MATAKDKEQHAEEPEVEAPAPTTVIAALARVMAEIGGIRKLTAQQRRERGMQGGDERGVTYAYRGIDQLAQYAQPLLGKYGVVIVPEVLSRETVNITVNGNPWTDTFVEVEWTLYGPSYGSFRPSGIPVDDKVTSITEGWGRDNSDKGINKAMTGAFKNLLLRVLCIGDPQDDTDGHTHEADAQPNRNETRDVPPVNDPVKQTFERLKGLAGTEIGEAVKEFAAGQSKSLTEKALADDPEWREELNRYVDAKVMDATALAQQMLGATEVKPEGDSVAPPAEGESEVAPPEEPKEKRKTAREIAAEKEAARKAASEESF